MVNTVKFSQFSTAGLNDANTQFAGLSTGANIINKRFPTWSTANRPSPPFDGLLGFNTDLDQYEFFNADTMTWVQLADSASPFQWNNVTAASQLMLPRNGYVANNAGVVTFTLPVTCGFGELLGIAGYGSGGWALNFNVGQNAILGKLVATTTTGSISSTNQYDQIEILCVVANTTFLIRNVIGNLTVI